MTGAVVTGAVVTGAVVTEGLAIGPLALDSPADLRVLMGTDYELSPQQWAAVSAPLEPAVVIAGAGSGKTSLMAARVVYLVATGQVTPDQVLGLTFTTKAASELGQRIRSALAAAGHGRGAGGPAGRRDGQGGDQRGDQGDDEVLEPVVATYNAYASSLLTEHGLRVGHEPDTRVLVDAARYQLAARVIARHTGPVELLSDSPKHVIDWLLRLEAAMSEHLVTPAVLRAFDERERQRFAEGLATAKRQSLAAEVVSAFARRRELMDLVEEYQRLKGVLGLMDFSDQVALAARLADLHPDVGAAERATYAVVLLDEYQDTSVAQAVMLRRLFGDGHPVTAVGDPHQAIYGWRGASVSNILRFGEDFPRADGRPVRRFPLTVNRRSDVRILEAANALASPLHTAGSDAVARLEPGHDAPGEVQTVVHLSHAAELTWLADEVVAEHAGRAEPGWREIGVLVRDNDHAAEVFDTLTARGVPVEIVGLKGLLRLPEVSEVLATLTLLQDLTANAELLALLTGPRWAVGPRDLALLGQRAGELAGARRGPARSETVEEDLALAVAGADPTEVPALSDALDDPGDLAYSRAARERFSLLSAELRALRSHAGEPLLDLVRRIVDACGIDVELASSVSEAARARRENLDLFVKAVADFQAIDGTVTLTSLLAWLEAEDDGQGLDVATPSEADSVKLLTVHRAKGLEWDAVFLVGACEGRFPHTRSRGLWPTRPELLPTPLRGDARDLPALGGHDQASFDAFRRASAEHEATEELRLGYVAFTRARHRLVVSSYLWKEQRKTPLGPSPYQQVIRDLLAGWGVEPTDWHDKPPKDTPNPLLAGVREVAWPVTEHTAEALRRLGAAELVGEAAADPAVTAAAEAELHLDEQALVAEWDEDIERLLTEARRESGPVVEVALPASLSATALVRLREDPETFAAELARPMPRPPSPAARFGTRFHAWVEARFGQQDLFDPDDLPGRGDAGIDDDADLLELVEVFERGPFASRPPLRVEAPFALVLGGQVVRGRIDAVYAEGDGFLVVDWKTSRSAEADPWQLALYRLAWAELAGVPVERVRAAFYFVRSDRVVEPPALPDRAGLEAVLDGLRGPPL